MKELIEKYLELGLITYRKHPTEDLWIANYTPDAQYGWKWDGQLEQFRGLILDNDYNIVSRSMPKFFNYEELKDGQIPDEPFDIFEKMDGSLGITYWVGGIPHISTRGSFESDQSKIGTDMIQSSNWSMINPNYTYLFEIIYPENRIVVDYGNESKLVLLAIIDTQTGQEVFDLEGWGYETPEKVSLESFSPKELQGLDEHNKEGFVLRYKSGFRMKVKFDTYKSLHKIVTGLNSKTIWKWLRTGENINDKLSLLPDEFYDWGRKEALRIELDYQRIEYDTLEDMANIYEGRSQSRKDFALKAQECKYPSILFSRLDNKDYKDQIWKLIEP